MVHASLRPGAGLGGTRVVLASPGGRDVAVVHRPKGPAGQAHAYTSPVRTVEFAHVGIDPAITFKTAVTATGYRVVAAIPWKVLGIEAVAGTSFRADFEVIFGSAMETHVQNVLRWMEAPHSVHDLPTESEFFPANFGTVILE